MSTGIRQHTPHSPRRSALMVLTLSVIAAVATIATLLWVFLPRPAKPGEWVTADGGYAVTVIDPEWAGDSGVCVTTILEPTRGDFSSDMGLSNLVRFAAWNPVLLREGEELPRVFESDAGGPGSRTYRARVCAGEATGPVVVRVFDGRWLVKP